MQAPVRRLLRLCTHAALAACTVALVAGCASSPRESGIPSAPKAARDARDASPGAVQPAEASAKAPRTPEQAIARAEERYAVGDEAGAVAILEQALAQSPAGPGSDAARLRLAELERRRGRIPSAANALARVRRDRLSAEQRTRALRLDASIAAAEHDPVKQLVALADLRSSAKGSDEVALLDADIDEAISTLTLDEATRAGGALRDRPPAARVRLRETELALEARNVDRAMLALAEASRLPLTPAEVARIPALEARAHALEEQGVGLPPPEAPYDPSLPLPPQRVPRPAAIPFTTGARGVLGVVLPLTGPRARFGELSLRGVLLAARVPRAGAAAGDDGLRLLVRDSNGTPAGAAAAVSELGAMPEVSAVIGPIGAEEAESAAVAAETVGVPLLALSPREGVSRDRPHVFRVGVAPRGEADALAEYAIASLGLRRFAVLHPNDGYGQGFSQVFQQAVQARGGEVVAVASYPLRTTDFAAAIQSLLAQAPKRLVAAGVPSVAATLGGGAKAVPPVGSGAEKRAPTPAGPPPFDAVFVADSREVAGVLVPQLAYHDLGSVRILGPRGWANPDLISVAQQQVEGAILAEPFDPASAAPMVREFVARYRSELGDEPDVFAAQAYDATVLVLAQLALGSASRDAVRAGLATTREVPGVAGATTIAADGNGQKRASLIAVVNGHLTPIPARYEDAGSY